MFRSRARAWFALSVLLAAAACQDEFGGGPRTVTRSGYRAALVYSPTDRYEVAVRGQKQRVSGIFDGSELVKIERPDLGKIWQFRPSTRKLIEMPWTPMEELVPGYPLDPHFDPEGYADRFHGTVRRVDDAALGMHPCERFVMSLPSGDRVTLWVARDLERLVVRIEHEKKDPKDEYQAVTDTRLDDVRLGAAGKLFEKPEGFSRVGSYAELGK